MYMYIILSGKVCSSSSSACAQEAQTTAAYQ